MTLSTLTATRPDFNHVVAFEVAKQTLCVYSLPGGVQDVFTNSRGCIRRKLKRELKRNAAEELGPLMVVCEATGGYECHVLGVCVELGIPCHKAHGSRIRAYARYRGMLAKTDPIDARLLAEFGLQTKDLRLYTPPRPEQARLRQLKSRRDDIQQLVQAEKNRLEHADDKVVANSIHVVIKILERQLARIEAEIKTSIDSDSELATSANLMVGVIGIGHITTVTLLAYLPELGRLTRGQAAMLTGLAPINKDSGQARAPRRIEAGRAQVRRCLYMAATVAIRHNPILNAFATRLTQDGKPFKVVITAVMRKLIVILNAIMRERQPWKHAKTA